MRIQSVFKAIVTIGLISSVAAIVWAAEELQKPSKGDEMVEFKMEKFVGEDGFPQYRTVDPHGALGNVTMSLRCIDNGYDTVAGKTYTWRYSEMMVFDAGGKDIKRKEPRANVATERGYRLSFSNLAECEKASPTILTDGAQCSLKAYVNKTSLKAKLISATCKP